MKFLLSVLIEMATKKECDPKLEMALDELFARYVSMIQKAWIEKRQPHSDHRFARSRTLCVECTANCARDVMKPEYPYTKAEEVAYKKWYDDEEEELTWLFGKYSV